jgi:putative ABC transport system ATP-binding protein
MERGSDGLVATDDWWAERRARVGGHHVRVLFECDHVSFRRGGAVVLEELTFGLSKGTTCIAGPSGAGKSTLLRLFNRLADPAVGTVRYRGRDVRDYDVLALRREVGLVPQLPALLDGTVAMNVSFGAQLAEKVADVPAALRLAGLDETFAARPAGRLSVGEQQRVMLARALALQPKVLLLDEPTAALDERSKAAVERTLRDLRKRLSLSVVFVTHELAQAERLADRIVWLEGGRLSRGPATVPS